MMTLIETRLLRLKQLIIPIIMKCWALSGVAVFTFLLVYWAYGGFFALFLLGFAVTGNLPLFAHMTIGLVKVG